MRRYQFFLLFIAASSCAGEPEYETLAIETDDVHLDQMTASVRESDGVLGWDLDSPPDMQPWIFVGDAWTFVGATPDRGENGRGTYSAEWNWAKDEGLTASQQLLLDEYLLVMIWDDDNPKIDVCRLYLDPSLFAERLPAGESVTQTYSDEYAQNYCSYGYASGLSITLSNPRPF